MRDWIDWMIERFKAADRQQRLYVILGVLVVAIALRYGIAWFGEHRETVRADIQQHAQRLANARQLLERAAVAEVDLARNRKRYAEVVAALLPGDSPTLAAAALQDRISSVATARGVSIQSTQVLREESEGKFQKAGVRVTASGELKNLAHFLAELEAGPPQINVTFVELNRRATAVRRVGAVGGLARIVSATLQISGFLRASALMEGDPEPAASEPAATAASVGDLKKKEPGPVAPMPGKNLKPSQAAAAGVKPPAAAAAPLPPPGGLGRQGAPPPPRMGQPPLPPPGGLGRQGAPTPPRVGQPPLPPPAAAAKNAPPAPEIPGNPLGAVDPKEGT